MRRILSLAILAVLLTGIAHAQNADSHIQVPAAVALKHRISGPADFSAAARQEQASGTVVVHVVIGKDGKVKFLEALSGPEVLRKPALDALAQWKFRPFVQNHAPVDVETQITCRFNYQRS